ncbi:MAG: leucine-rich repeat protein [Eubacterium sp.]
MNNKKKGLLGFLSAVAVFFVIALLVVIMSYAFSPYLREKLKDETKCSVNAISNFVMGTEETYYQETNSFSLKPFSGEIEDEIIDGERCKVANIKSVTILNSNKTGEKPIVIPSTALGYQVKLSSDFIQFLSDNRNDLKNVIFESNNDLYTIEDDFIYTSDKKEIVFYFGNETEFKIPDGIEKIGNYAFANTDIKELTVPKSVKSIGNAFDGCPIETLNVYDVFGFYPDRKKVKRLNLNFSKPCKDFTKCACVIFYDDVYISNPVSKKDFDVQEFFGITESDVDLTALDVSAFDSDNIVVIRTEGRKITLHFEFADS